jgi:hypothetical protein
MKKTLLIGLGVIAAGGCIIYFTRPTQAAKLAYLQNIDGTFKPAPFDKMLNTEISDCYDFIMATKNNRSISDALKARIQVISTKYNIFT